MYTSIVKKHKTDLKNTKVSMYYIMLTDGHLRFAENDTMNKYFPGHVFILEKSECMNTDTIYRIYQSYIGKYSLNDQLIKNKCKVHSLEEIKPILTFFKKFLSPKHVWDKETVRYWKLLTDVNSEEFVGYETSNIFLCYRLFSSSTILKNLQRFVNKHLNLIKFYEKKNPNYFHTVSHSMLSSKPNDIYVLKQDYINMKNELSKNK